MGVSRPLVLVADDDRDIRTLLVTLLERAGFEVATAADGVECLLKLQVRPPAALVLDILMPDVGGLRVLDQLAAEHATVPVVVMTGRADAAHACRRRLGEENVFDKPLDGQRLVARLRALARGGAG